MTITDPSVEVVNVTDNIGAKTCSASVLLTTDTAEFGVIALPAVASDGSLLPVKFDWQLKYIDCPTTLTDAYSGQSSTYQKGWSFIMKKVFGGTAKILLRKKKNNYIMLTIWDYP